MVINDGCQYDSPVICLFPRMQDHFVRRKPCEEMLNDFQFILLLVSDEQIEILDVGRWVLHQMLQEL